MTIRPIIAVLTIAGTTFALTGCEPMENLLTLANGGTPMPGGPSQPQVSIHLASVPAEGFDVATVEVKVPPVEPVECVVPAHLFRSMQCDETTGELIPIR